MMVIYYVYKVANDCFCQIFIICGYYEQLTFFWPSVWRWERLPAVWLFPWLHEATRECPGFVLGWVTSAGWSPRREWRQRPRRRAAREETQNNRQGNQTQNNKLASTKERSLLESHHLRTGGWWWKRVSEGDSMPLRFQRIPLCK